MFSVPGMCRWTGYSFYNSCSRAGYRFLQKCSQKGILFSNLCSQTGLQCIFLILCSQTGCGFLPLCSQTGVFKLRKMLPDRVKITTPQRHTPVHIRTKCPPGSQHCVSSTNMIFLLMFGNSYAFIRAMLPSEPCSHPSKCKSILHLAFYDSLRSQRDIRFPFTDLKSIHTLSLASTRITNKIFEDGTMNLFCNLFKLNVSRTKISDAGLCHLHLGFLEMINADQTYTSPVVVATIEGLCTFSDLYCVPIHFIFFLFI